MPAYAMPAARSRRQHARVRERVRQIEPDQEPSIAKNGRSGSATKVSTMRSTFGCRTRAAASASRWNRRIELPRRCSVRKTFSAKRSGCDSPDAAATLRSAR